MIRKAHFSNCKLFRFALKRQWNDYQQQILFIGLNPSNADDKKDDRTISKCISYAKSWGYGGFTMVNLFSYVDSDPKNLRQYYRSHHEVNLKYIKEEMAKHSSILFMWGNLPKHCTFDFNELRSVKNPLCFCQNKNGMPRHPLYLPLNSKPKAYNFD